MPTIPYIHFDGHCAEALTHYADVFGGTDLQMMRYSDAPDMPEAMKDPNRIIHGQVTLGGGVLMASDYPPGMVAEKQAAVSIMQGVGSVASAQAIFDRLADGGQVVQAFGQEPREAARFGEAVERIKPSRAEHIKNSDIAGLRLRCNAPMILMWIVSVEDFERFVKHHAGAG